MLNKVAGFVLYAPIVSLVHIRVLLRINLSIVVFGIGMEWNFLFIFYQILSLMIEHFRPGNDLKYENDHIILFQFQLRILIFRLQVDP
jgi:hypothetical protein